MINSLLFAPVLGLSFASRLFSWHKRANSGHGKIVFHATVDWDVIAKGRKEGHTDGQIARYFQEETEQVRAFDS